MINSKSDKNLVLQSWKKYVAQSFFSANYILPLPWPYQCWFAQAGSSNFHSTTLIIGGKGKSSSVPLYYFCDSLKGFYKIYVKNICCKRMICLFLVNKVEFLWKKKTRYIAYIDTVDYFYPVLVLILKSLLPILILTWSRITDKRVAH